MNLRIAELHSAALRMVPTVSNNASICWVAFWRRVSTSGTCWVFSVRASYLGDLSVFCVVPFFLLYGMGTLIIYIYICVCSASATWNTVSRLLEMRYAFILLFPPFDTGTLLCSCSSCCTVGVFLFRYRFVMGAVCVSFLP